MSKRSPTYYEVKLHAVKLCLQNKSYPSYEAKQLGVSKNTVREWIRKYKTMRCKGLKESNTWKTHSMELKLTAIKDLLSGSSSIEEATKSIIFRVEMF